MPFKGDDFQWTLDEAIADNTRDASDPDEYSDRLVELIRVVNGTRHEYAKRLREHIETTFQDDNPTTRTLRAIMSEMADRVDPYKELDYVRPDAFKRNVVTTKDGVKRYS